MRVFLGIFNKTVNSTKKVNVNTLKEYDLVLKDGCDVLTPIFRLQTYSENDLKNLNYAYIPTWGRYYFVKDVRMLTGKLLELTLAIDVLGTYRDSILSQWAYVKRSESHWDEFMPDPCWSHSSRITRTTIGGNLKGYNTTGTYVIQTACKDPTAAYPSVGTYAVSNTKMQELIRYVFSQTFYDKVLSGAGAENKSLAKTFFNPFQYVISCRWFPFDYASFSGVEIPISFGWWDSNVSGKALPKAYITVDLTYTQNVPANNWTDRDNNWTRILSYVPGFGTFEIDAMYTGTTLTGSVCIDVATGTAVLDFKSDDKMIMQINGKLGIGIQLSALYKDLAPGNSISSLLGNALGDLTRAGMSTIESLFTFNKEQVTGHEPKSANTVSNAISGALSPTPCLNGATEAVAALKTFPAPRLSVRKFSPKDPTLYKKLGGIANKNMALSELSGYTELVEPKLTINGTLGEKQMISTILSGGIYIE